MSLVAKTLQAARKTYVPLFVNLEIDQRCNFSCLHCYNFDRDSAAPILSAPILSRQEILDLIPKISKSGCLYLSFTGGEPTMHPHLLEFIAQARAHHMVAKIKTNGSTLNSPLLKKMIEAGLQDLDISLYGMTDKTYADFTGKAMAQAVLEGIVCAKKAGLSPQINFILHRHNIHELDAMLDFVKDHDLPYSLSIEMTARHDGNKNAKQTAITKEQFLELTSGPHKDFFLARNETGELRCSCAKTVCGIGQDGKVYPCIGAPMLAGDVRERDFADIWKNSSVLKHIRTLENEDFKECFSCEMKYSCQRSSGSALVNTGNYQGIDPATCELTAARFAIHNR